MLQVLTPEEIAAANARDRAMEEALSENDRRVLQTLRRSLAGADNHDALNHLIRQITGGVDWRKDSPHD